jgi:hypothetical protein
MIHFIRHHFYVEPYHPSRRTQGYLTNRKVEISIPDQHSHISTSWSPDSKVHGYVLACGMEICRARSSSAL